MGYCLFLDDERNLDDVTWVSLPKVNNDWKTVRNFDQFTLCIASHGMPKFIAFDHDLADYHYDVMAKEADYHTAFVDDDMGGLNITSDYGSEKTGYDCAKWLADYCADNRLKLPEYVVHSLNPVGRQRIEAYLDNAKVHLNL